METFKIVYLIDDDPLVNMINQRVLYLANFSSRVVVYSKATLALKALNQLITTNPEEFPEVIFLDTNMPEMDGWGFIEEFNKFPENILEICKLYILSSSIDIKEINRAKTYKTVQDFISKPLSIGLLEGIGNSFIK